MVPTENFQQGMASFIPTTKAFILLGKGCRKNGLVAPRNGRRQMKDAPNRAFLFLLAMLCCFCTACADIQPEVQAPPPPDPVFEVDDIQGSTKFATPDEVRQFSHQSTYQSDGAVIFPGPVHQPPGVPLLHLSILKKNQYIIGPGDVLSLSVWGRPDASSPRMIVGPDGVISVPRIGFINTKGRTRDSVTEEIKGKLQVYYSKPEISFSIDEYHNNKAFVLGRVENPGMVTFPGEGTLLEALSIAGGYSTEAEDTYLTKCSIIRGNDTIIWIDLNELLQNGNMALNARIVNNDVIFIPESQSELVYVMGEVRNPGAYNMTGRLTLLDSLMMAGGPTDDAKKSKLYLIRKTINNKGQVREIDLQHLLASADFSQNYIMKDNDVLYVSEKGISRFNYVLQKIFPSLEIIELGTNILENFGAMEPIRVEIWGDDE
jgi:protein involved in polysaccharide export with SLBB domain